MRSAIILGLLGAAVAAAQPAAAQTATVDAVEIYGFAQVDVIYDFNRVNPAWDDTLRPSKIPTTQGTFGDNGQTAISAKQSRFGAKATGQAADRPYEVKFEFDLFGVGTDEGQTTFRLRHAYGRWGPILGGQTNSLFMDGDLFPNTVDYWGPTGMVFLRNPQIRFYITDSPAFSAAVALEKPGNDIDPGRLRQFEPVLGADLRGTEKLPDLTGHVRWMGDWGHVQVAGILRKVGFETLNTPGNEPEGSEVGWGVNVGTSLNVAPATFRVGVVYGEGIASYMNDGGMDLAPRLTGIIPAPGGPTLQGEAKAVPLVGVTAYMDWSWSDTLTSSVGYSLTQVDNTNFQDATAYRRGQYASANVLWAPTSRVLTGVEVLWGEREDNDGNKGDDVRVQYTFKLSFTTNDLAK